ncbi:MAG TPA: NYN domain-containing protein [Anaerolineae bacterium]|nr:NYN domain-containing protein [Anaerolineae bacterium]
MQKLLIDGHNLIGQTPGLSLADPNDEQKLVVMLRQYAARKNARIVVVFDSGNPGGKSKELSGGHVTAIFAGSHTIADRVLMERIRELKQPGDWVVVSSDREVQQAAQQRKMNVWSSTEFAKKLGAAPQRAIEPPEAKDSGLTKAEVDEWLQVFKRRK